MEQSKFSNSNIIFVIVIYFDDSGGFEGCHYNKVSCHYYIAVELFQSNHKNNNNNKNNETRAACRIFASNFHQANKAKLRMIKFAISQHNNIIAIIETDTVINIPIFRYLRYLSTIMNMFHNDFIADNMQNIIFNNLFHEYIMHITSKLHTIFSIDNINCDVNTDGTLDSIEINLRDNILSNCSRLTIWWISTDYRYNDCDGNNDNLVIILSTIRTNAISNSILNVIFGTKTTSLDAELYLLIANCSLILVIVIVILMVMVILVLVNKIGV